MNVLALWCVVLLQSVMVVRGNKADYVKTESFKRRISSNLLLHVTQLYLQRGAFDFYVHRQDDGVHPLRLSVRRRLKTTCWMTAGDD